MNSPAASSRANHAAVPAAAKLTGCFRFKGQIDKKVGFKFMKADSYK